MIVAVTGATGFIGRSLVYSLLDRGFHVRCLVRNEAKASHYFGDSGNVELFLGDLRNCESLRGFLEGVDIIFHIGAMVSDWGEREDFYKVNVEATRFLLDQAIDFNVKRFVFMSSSTVVWNPSFFSMTKLEDIDETHPYPSTFLDYYNESKAKAEQLVVEYGQKLHTIIIRPSNVWGEGDTVILPRLIDAANKGILYPIGFGKRTTTPCHITNLIHSMILCMDACVESGSIYFMNDGEKIDYKDFISDQLKAAGVEWNPRVALPYTLMYAIGWILENIYRFKGSRRPPAITRFAVAALAGNRCYSIEKARRELGFKPVVTYNEGLKKLEEWVKECGGAEQVKKLGGIG